MDAKLSRENDTIRSLAVLEQTRGRNIFHSIGLDATWEQGTAARSMKKMYGHADILSSKLRNLDEAWEALGRNSG